MESAIHWINHYPRNNSIILLVLPLFIWWIRIYPVDSAIQFEQLGRGACFSKIPKLYWPISSVTIPSVSQEWRGFKSSNLTAILLFCSLENMSEDRLSKTSFTNRPNRLTQCCTQFKSPGTKIFCVLYLHDNVAFIFK